MRKNILSSIFGFLTITGILIPLYSNISTYGVIIAIALGILGSICIYKYYGILEEEKINMLNKIEDISNKMDHAVKQMNSFQEEGRDSQKKMSEYLTSLNFGQEKFYSTANKQLDRIEKLFDNELKTLNNNNKDMTDAFAKNVDEVIKDIKVFCTEINEIIKNENERNSDILTNVSSENKKHMEIMSVRVGQVVEDIKALLTNRIDEDMKALNQIKNDTAENLEKINEIIENNDKFNKDHLENLNKNVMECFMLYNSGQKKFYEQTRNQIDSIKNNFDEMIEDLEDNQEDILKTQSKNVNIVLEEMKDIVKELNNNIEVQSQKHEEEVEAIKKLQDEILNLNQKDIELIKVMLDEDEK